jgi:ribosome biogenesis GTPase A
MSEIHWYPGHMAKAKREFVELLKYLDVVLEVRDARIPAASHNPDLDKLLSNRSVVVLLNKNDLADVSATNAWLDWFATQGGNAIAMNGKTGEGLNQVWDAMERNRRLASLKRPILRAGVVGIPNVGKSTILNRLLGRNTARTGNRPGITRGKQWIRQKGFEVLDMPGLLPPKIANKEDAVKLALIGTIREEIIPANDLALLLMERYGEVLFSSESLPQEKAGMERLIWYANRRSFISKGGHPDLNRAVTSLLKEFRNGRLGRITLETPPSKLPV